MFLVEGSEYKVQHEMCSSAVCEVLIFNFFRFGLMNLKGKCPVSDLWQSLHLI